MEPARNVYDEESEEPKKFGVLEGGGEGDGNPSGELRPIATPHDSVYDSDDKNPVTRPNLRALEGGGEGDGKSSAKLKSLNSSELENKEKNDLSPKLASDQVGKGFNGNDTKSSISRLKGMITKKARRRVAIGVVAATLGFGGFAGFAILQGPLQFIHFAQNLRKFHLMDNEEFGDNRGSKVLVYALYGSGREKTRLGVVANAAANSWEKKMAEKTGMKPIYSKPLGRHIGFEIVDDKKAQNFLDGVNDSKKTRAWNKVNASILGDKAEIVKASEIRDSKGSLVKSTAADGNMVVSLAKTDFDNRRAWIKTMGRAMNTNSLVGSYGTRMLKKRGGVDFHLMNKLKEKLDDGVNKRLDDRRKTEISNGVENPVGDPNNKTETVDENGNKVEVDKPPDVVEANNETKKFIEEFKQSGAFKTAKGAAVAVGVLCAARSFGDQVEEYKYSNNYMPQLRMGMGAVGQGFQVMSNDDYSMANLEYANKFMHDQETKTSFSQAEAYVAETGGTGGVKMPEEASVKNLKDKPRLFELLDQIPVLGNACDIQNSIGNIWGIKQVLGVINDGTMLAIDGVLKPFGTSSDELLLSALRVVSGTSVNPLAKGADFGNMATAGAFFGANDTAIAMGGTSLSTQQRVELKEMNSEYQSEDNSQKTFYAKYFDPYSPDTITASIIDNGNYSSVANTFTNLSFFANVFKPLNSKVSAATSIPYDYGVPKYGFSKSLQRDARFEDPYLNAEIVEKNLDNLNSQYGECFGTKVTENNDGIKIESDKSVNVFKLADKCKNNNDEMFLRYRFYIADAVTAISLACNDGDEEACSQIGVGEGPSSGGDQTGSEASQSGEGTKPIQPLNAPSNNVDCPTETPFLGKIDLYLDGVKKPANICKLPNVICTNEECNGGYGIPGNPDGHAIVNSRVAGAWYALVEAAKKDGITISSNSSLRTNEHQRSICLTVAHEIRSDGTCKSLSDLVASQGYSPHEGGYALDIPEAGHTTGGKTCSSRANGGTATYNWLKENASKFGIFQYSAESWHWDANPLNMDNRC